FTASFHGLITADPRYCADFPPGEEPADCDAAIDPVSAEDSFTAGAGESDSSLFLPFFLSGTGNGWMHFSQTDGSAVRINIQNATLVDTSGLGSGIGSAVPEPAAWTMMLLGFAFVGRALRSRRVSFGALRGDGTIAAKLRRRR
ncbi:MAG: PEP-CTERM sorting domain-containing protein, partial [Sphingomonas sp.]|nr:PEP-CTERM sorting domain-containing protein [Sphingomonas sp.]